MGDYIRWAPPYYGSDEQNALGTRSSLYLSLNRGKRSVRLDLKRRGRPRRLPAPGRALRRRPRRLPPRRPRPARGRLRAAARGQPGDRLLRDHRLRPGRPLRPARRPRHQLPRPGRPARAHRRRRRPAGLRPAGQIADLGGGALMAAVGVMAALHERQRSGEGQAVDVSMADGALSWLAMVAGRYLCDGEVPRRGDGPALRRDPLLPALRGRRRLGQLRRPRAEVLGQVLRSGGEPSRPHRGASSSRPAQTAGAEVAAVFRSRSRDEWKAFNDEHDCCIEPILDLDEALDSELVRERGMVVEVEQPRARHGAPARRCR